MNAVRMTSCSARSGRTAGEGANAQRVLPASALSAATSAETASSRSASPSATEFSISSRDTMSTSMALIAVTILPCWRSKSSVRAAPRGPVGLQLLTVIGLPARSVKNVQAPGWVAL